MNRDDRERIDAVFASHLPHLKMVDVDSRTLGFEALDDSTHCDFCNATPVTAQFDAHDVPITTVNCMKKNTVYVSRGAWGACATCAELVEINARDRLLKRAFDERLGAFDDITPAHLREQVRGEQRETLRRAHRAFWKARIA